MIRVIVRNIDEAEGALLGDFPPSEIPALLDLLNAHELYLNGDEQLFHDDDGDYMQWADVGGKTSKRVVLEVLTRSTSQAE